MEDKYINKKANNWLEKIAKEHTEAENELLSRAANTLLGNILEGEDLPWYPRRCIVPGLRYFRGIWNWDTAFHAMGVRHWDIELAKECIEGFIQFQCEDGMFPDVIFETGRIAQRSAKPPVLPWAAELICREEMDIEFIKRVYPRFAANEKFWTERRCYNGLFYYDAGEPEKELYERYIRYESGWDDSVRWDKPILELWPIDLNCFMVMFYRAMKYFSEQLELKQDAAKWAEKEAKLVKLINEELWDDVQKCYVDVNRFTKEKSDVLSPASFMPLYVQIASKDRAECMNALACDRNKFYSGMPTVAYDHPEHSDGYWRGRTWLNVAYFAAKGLKNYGFPVGDEIKATILGWCEKYKEAIHENYNSVTGAPMGHENFSWSATFVIEFILEW